MLWTTIGLIFHLQREIQGKILTLALSPSFLLLVGQLHFILFKIKTMFNLKVKKVSNLKFKIFGKNKLFKTIQGLFQI